MKTFYKLTPIKLGYEVRGIDLKVENRPEVIEQIKSDVSEHRLLVFKDQGIISMDRQIEISKWFGELKVTFYHHERSPYPELLRISNDEKEGKTDAGTTGWHIDGTYDQPDAYSIYHMVSVPKKGATVFAPLTEIIDNLPSEKYAEWDRIWMKNKKGPFRPLIYMHPKTKKKVLCFHLGKTAEIVYDYGSPGERHATPEEFKRILDDIKHEFEKDNGKIQYKHDWEEGDFVFSDNLAVGHKASEEIQAPISEVGLRVLHRTTVLNPIFPAKSY